MKDTEQVSVIEGQACLGCALDMMSGRPLWDHWQATWPQTNFLSFLSFQFHTVQWLVIMYSCESSTINKVEQWETDSF